MVPETRLPDGLASFVQLPFHWRSGANHGLRGDDCVDTKPRRWSKSREETSGLPFLEDCCPEGFQGNLPCRNHHRYRNFWYEGSEMMSDPSESLEPLSGEWYA